MFIELEPIFNNVGSSKKFSYSFVPDGIDFTDNVSVEGEVVNNTDIVSVKAVAKYVLKQIATDAVLRLKGKLRSRLSTSLFLVLMMKIMMSLFWSRI